MAVSSHATDAERLRRIERITDATLAHLDVPALLGALLDEVSALLGVDTAAVLLLDPSGTRLVATAARGIEEEVRQNVRIPVGEGFAGRVAAERRPVVLDRVDTADVVNPILRDREIASMLGVPLVADGRLLGVLHVGTLRPRLFTAEDTTLLTGAADRIALVTRSRLSDLDRATATALQRSLMPGELPVVSGMEFAARYVPGETSGLGGDWYDVFTLPTGHLGVVIGDVVGRGLRAAVVMGRLRSALRAFALEENDPAEVLERLDANVQHFEDDVMATVLYAVVEPSLERLAISTAGHLAPVLARPGEPAAPVELPVDLPVGVAAGPPRRRTVVELPPRALLFLYTDGLIERRDRPLQEGLDALHAAVTAVTAGDDEEDQDAEDVCRAVVRRLLGDASVADDVAMLALRRQGAPSVLPLTLVVAAVPRALREVRSAARRWLVAAGASPEDVADVLVALGEACANVVEHAYGPAGGRLTVQVELHGATVVAAVRDHGRWRPARGHDRGRGTALIRRCSDEVDVNAGAGGTTVTFRRHLHADRDPE